MCVRVHMMKEMSLSSGVRTQRVFVWVSIIWFTSAVPSAVGQMVTLETINEVAARCGENVTLTCVVRSSDQLNIISFSWVAKGKSNLTCEGCGVLCERAAQSSHCVTLTLLNVMPLHRGAYLCKLRSTQASRSAETLLTVQDCLESSGSSVGGSQAACWFSGVYPSGAVHWFQGEVNLTAAASTREEVDPHGRYNVSSAIDVQKGNRSLPYKCSLWIPSAGKLLATQELPSVEEQTRSSGNKVKLQWICMMVVIMKCLM